MLHSLFLLIAVPATASTDSGATPAALSGAEPAAITAVALQTPVSKEDPEYAKRKKEAGKDPGKLWKLYEWCKEQKKEKEAKAALKEIIKADPTHKEANIALGNLYFDGKWFENQKKIDEYKKTKELEDKKAQGLVDYKGAWVPKEDVPFLEKGLVKDDLGNWVTGEIAQKVKDGWVKQDLVWVAPTEKENIEKGLWKCDDKWLTLADADVYHAEIGQWWKIPTERFVLWTTCDRDVAISRIKPQLDQAVEDLEKVYATKVPITLHVMVLRNADQYGTYAAGDEDTGRESTDAFGLSSVHYAYFGDLVIGEDDQIDNMGVAYWDDSTDAGKKFGVHAVRHGMGQSFSEAIDPSPKASAKLKKTGTADEAYVRGFYDEKRIPKWFRYGAAAYAERYFEDKGVGIGGDRQWVKKWSVKNILGQGGLRPLKQIFEFSLRADQGQDGGKLINEAGLLVAFAKDGGIATVTEKLKAAQDALKENKDKKAVGEAFKALEAEITKNEAELRKFAGI